MLSLYLLIYMLVFLQILQSIYSLINLINGNSLSNESENLEPFFIDSGQREIITTLNQTVKFHCVVQNLGDRAVSWIRKKDLHILTVGVIRYTKDKRFQTIHHDHSNEWILQISATQFYDTGIYECQINTEPKFSQYFILNITDLKAHILGNRESYVNSGTDINLTCTINAQINEIGDNYIPPLNKPVEIMTNWYKDNNLIVNNYKHYNGVTVSNGLKIITYENEYISHLFILKANDHDSGFYTCSPRSGHNDTVIIHVINGEQSAAMHHGISNAIHQRFHSLFFINFIIIFIHFFLFLSYLFPLQKF